MASLGDLTATLGINSNPWISGLNKSARGLGGFVKNVTKGFAQIGLAVEGAKAVFGGLIGPMQEAQEAALAQRKMVQVFKSTGNAAGVAASDIMAFADARQRLTSFDADDTINAAGTLGSFTNIKGDAFTRTLESAQDLSAFLGTDLQSSIMQLGRALNDPAKGMAALSRSGIQFSESQREQIKALQEVGDLAGAQNVIFKEMEKQFGGQAKALVDPLKQVGNAWGDLMEKVGTVANEKLLPLIPKMIEGFENLAEVVERIGKAIDGISNAGDILSGKQLTGRDKFVAEMEAKLRPATGDGPGIADVGRGLMNRMDFITGGKASDFKDSIAGGAGSFIGQVKSEVPKFPAAFEEAKEKNKAFASAELQGRKMLAGFVRDGLGFMESSLMSLGPAVKSAGPRQEIGSLEAGTQEAFDVMRANVGPGGGKDVQKDIFAESKKTTKLLEKIEKNLGRKLTDREQAEVVIRNID